MPRSTLVALGMPDEPQQETPSQMASRLALEAIEREVAAWDRPVHLPTRRVRRAGTFSIVYSVRLSRAEVETLERRAAELGMQPTVVARNLIRVGLAIRMREDVAETVARLDQVVQELRALVG